MNLECNNINTLILEFFIIKRNEGYKKVRFYINNYVIINGKISFENEEDYNLYLNMADYYYSCIIQDKLIFFKPPGLFKTYNVFTSILCSVKILNKNISKDNIILKFLSDLNLESINIIDSDYFTNSQYGYYSLFLLKLETKIIFWLKYFISTLQDNNINNNLFFLFYQWCFFNLKNINTPKDFKDSNKIITLYSNHMENIDLTDNNIKLLEMRKLI